MSECQRDALRVLSQIADGSVSDRGASSDLLASTLERIVATSGGGRADYLRAVSGSVCASGDMAHATNPNYADRHVPGHYIDINGRPVLKINQNLRYATDAISAGHFALACDQAGVPMPWSRFSHPPGHLDTAGRRSGLTGGPVRFA